MPDYSVEKVGALSPRVTVAHPEENARQALQMIQAALLQGVQAMVLPALYLSGATCGDLFRHAILPQACEAALLWLAEQTKQSSAVIAIGLPVRFDGKIYSCAAALQGGAIRGLVPNNCLTHAESRYFSPYAGEPQTVRFGGREVLFGKQRFGAVGITFGEPIQSCALVLHLAAEAEYLGLHEKRRRFLSERSAHCCYAYAGAGVGESTTDNVYAGACLVAARGRILAESERYRQQGSAVYAETGRLLSPVAAQPLPKEPVINPSPFVPQDPVRRASCCREALELQTAALAKRLTHTGLKRMVIGISGGLDSTLALLVAARTADLLRLPRAHILSVTMPGYGTSAFTRATVNALCEDLRVALREIDIRPGCELQMRDIGHDPDAHDVVYENVQARQRTQTLMNLANQEQALLVGTGDLSELALGWCTYNADHMSMYNPNAGVPKTLMRAMLQYEAERGVAAKALARVLETPVSPELLPPDAQGRVAQKTEDILGSYDVHDFYLYHFMLHALSPRALFELATQAFPGYTPAQRKQWLLIFLRRFFSQQFKRSCLPDGPAVCDVSLSPRGAWQMPSDASAALWLNEAEAIEL